MSDKKRKTIFNILDFIFLMVSYMLCDLLAEKYNLVIGIIVGLIGYMAITLVLSKLLKIKLW